MSWCVPDRGEPSERNQNEVKEHGLTGSSSLMGCERSYTPTGDVMADGPSVKAGASLNWGSEFAEFVSEPVARAGDSDADRSAGCIRH